MGREMTHAEHLHKRAGPFFLVGTVQIESLQNRQQILFDRQTAKYRRFLRQIADPGAGALVDRCFGKIVVV